MSILLTGGLGFIGSHTAVELLNNNYNVIIVDNLSNSKKKTLSHIQQISSTTNARVVLYENDIADVKTMESIFSKHNIECVIHFAAYKSVSESIDMPLKYYRNNVANLIDILSLCEKHDINRFVFSSSATVYGSVNTPPLTEQSITGQQITNPYGQTKYMCENILKDACVANKKLQVFCLRYFNPVGAHPSGLIGEDPNGIPNNLMPYVVRTAIKNNVDNSLDDCYATLKIFGNDYETPDKTAIRDFIHVVDLAKAHVCCVSNTQNGFNVYNIGTGKGCSVKELIETFKRINNVTLPYVYAQKRKGDIPAVFCDASKAKKELHWVATKTIQDMCRDAYNFVSIK